MRLLQSGTLAGKKILLIDRDAKKNNDRTWCFWEQEEGFFEKVVYKKWDSISFLSDSFSAEMNISPYRYKMIRGIDFYRYCFTQMASHPHIEFVEAGVDDWEYTGTTLKLVVNKTVFVFENVLLFNSIYRPAVSNQKHLQLLQHFKGWIIRTGQDLFDPSGATMMDFRISQEQGTSFVYVLPFDPKTALVEYTLFTRQLLAPAEYDNGLKEYIHTFLGITDYTVTEEEFGVIPMTNEKFSFSCNGWNIGTAGGQTKASSGYTFQFIQKQSQQIADCLAEQKPLASLDVSPGRFRFYDNTLLEILYHDKLPGKEIFTTLFSKNKPQQVLKFLDNETTVKEELKIISTLPTWPFLKAALKQL